MGRSCGTLRPPAQRPTAVVSHDHLAHSQGKPKKPMCSLEFSIENSTNKVGILKHGLWYVVMILANKVWMGSLLVDHVWNFLKQHERQIIHFIGGGRAIHWCSNTPLEAVRQTFQPQSGRLRCNACFHLPVQVVWEKPSKNRKISTVQN